MTELLSDIETPSDAELISRVRGGDVAAYGELFSRHVQAATRLARQLIRGPDADDLVSDAFARVLTVLQDGGGPDVAFRAYLLTAVRRLHVDRVRAGSRLQTSDDMSQFDPGIPFQDTAVSGFESGAAAKAFASLPERWQLVLWHLEVEGQKPAEIAPLLGMSANSVSALAYRAREGLRQAFLTMHLSDISAEQCRWVNEHLGAYVRNGLAKRDAAKVEDHLRECRRCTAMYLELTEVNSNLKAIIAPLLLGAAATGYLTSTGSLGTAGVLSLLGRVRDVVLAHAGVAATGAAAAGVAAVATTVVLVTHSGHPNTVTSADHPLSTTTHIATTTGRATTPAAARSSAAATGSPSGGPLAPGGLAASATTPAVTSFGLTAAGAAPGQLSTGAGTGTQSGGTIGTGPGTGPGTGTGPVTGTGPGTGTAGAPGSPATTPAAPATGPTDRPSNPQPSHSPTGGPTGTPTTPPPTHQTTPPPTKPPTTPPPTQQPTGLPTGGTGGNNGGSTGGAGDTGGTTGGNTGNTGGTTGGNTDTGGDNSGPSLPSVDSLNPGFAYDSSAKTLTVSIARLNRPTSKLRLDMTSGGSFGSLPTGCDYTNAPTDTSVTCMPAMSSIGSGMSAVADVTAGPLFVTLPVNVDAGATSLTGTLSVDGYDGTASWNVDVPPATVDLYMHGLTPSSVTTNADGVYQLTGSVSGLTDDVSAVTFTVGANDPSGSDDASSTNLATFAYADDLPSGGKCSPVSGSSNEVTCTGLADNEDIVFPIRLVDAHGQPTSGNVYVKVTPVGATDTDPTNDTASAAILAPTPAQSVQLTVSDWQQGTSAPYWTIHVEVSGAEPNKPLDFEIQDPKAGADKPRAVAIDSITPDDDAACDSGVSEPCSRDDGTFSASFLIRLPAGHEGATLTVSDGSTSAGWSLVPSPADPDTAPVDPDTGSDH